MKISNLKSKLIWCSVIAAIVLVMLAFKLPCPIYFIFNFPCPGCGMTRAWLSAFRFDFLKAFEFHPLFWEVPILLIFYLFDGKIFKQKWLNTCLEWGLLMGFIVVWIIRLILE